MARNATPEIATAEQAQHVITARAREYCREHGNRSALLDYLQRADLGKLIDMGGSDWQVNLTSFVEALAQATDGTVTIHSDRDEPTMGSVRDLAHNYVRNALDSWYGLILQNDLATRVAKVPEAVDEGAIIAEYGALGVLTFTGDGETEARRLVESFLDTADDRRDCDTVEAIMIRIGLGSLMPPREIRRIVTVPNVGDLTVTIPCSRKGVPDMTDMPYIVQKAVNDYWVEQVKTLEFREVPADESVTADAAA